MGSFEAFSFLIILSLAVYKYVQKNSPERLTDSTIYSLLYKTDWKVFQTHQTKTMVQSENEFYLMIIEKNKDNYVYSLYMKDLYLSGTQWPLAKTNGDSSRAINFIGEKCRLALKIA